MKRQDFHFSLPDALIARFPLPERSASRLLCLDGNNGTIHHARFADLPGLLRAGDLLVLNDTRVLAARLLGQKASGGKVEVLLERLLDEQVALAHIRAGRACKPGTRLSMAARDQRLPAIALEVMGRDDDLFRVRLLSGHWDEVLPRYGHIPLPPYLQREDEASDQERYQTVYGCEPGAVAAPTAGLHFDAGLLEALRAKGVATVAITLHVGAGTFQPVRVDNLANHRMHRERIRVSPAVCEAIARARQAGGRVVAVGTTVVRALESAARSGQLQPFEGETDIFITPGYDFRVVDALVTNFHLPESTLLMLVCAFAGREHVLAAYAEAIREGYRFYSYGDAMFVTRRNAA